MSRNYAPRPRLYPDRATRSLGKLRGVSAERADRSQTTVVIADDHTVVRQGLRMLIDNEDGLQVIAEAGTVPDAERMARAHRPSVLVLDLNRPGGSSLEAIPRLREQAADTAIVVLTMQDDPAFARQALQAGALGFVLKEAADDELLEAIRQASNGGTYLNPTLGARRPAQLLLDVRAVGLHGAGGEEELLGDL